MSSLSNFTLLSNYQDPCLVQIYFVRSMPFPSVVPTPLVFSSLFFGVPIRCSISEFNFLVQSSDFMIFVSFEIEKMINTQEYRLKVTFNIERKKDEITIRKGYEEDIQEKEIQEYTKRWIIKIENECKRKIRKEAFEKKKQKIENLRKREEKRQ